MNTASARSTGSILNGLIVACNDDILVHKSAARAVAGSRQQRLENSAHARATFVSELGDLVRDLGEKPRKGGTFFEQVLEFHSRARALVIGDHAGDRYSACARVEGKTEMSYERALQRPLPDSVRIVLERQHAEIASDRQEFRRRRVL